MPGRKNTTENVRGKDIGHILLRFDAANKLSLHTRSLLTVLEMLMNDTVGYDYEDDIW